MTTNNTVSKAERTQEELRAGFILDLRSFLDVKYNKITMTVEFGDLDGEDKLIINHNGHTIEVVVNNAGFVVEELGMKGGLTNGRLDALEMAIVDYYKKNF